tara:strand:+ start:19471 stop:19611 length:141 start_codon:yes stop_codon:yes gene_type:complete
MAPHDTENVRAAKWLACGHGFSRGIDAPRHGAMARNSLALAVPSEY